MASFYTSVTRYGNTLLYLGYENNKRVKERIKFEPTVYVKSQKKSKYRTLDGHMVSPMKPGTMRETKEFIERNEADNWKIYGQLDYPVQYIHERFPKGADFDSSVINRTTIDIETRFGGGIEDVIAGNQEITAITVKNNIDNIFYTFGTGDWSHDKCCVDDLKDSMISYKKCKSEVELLLQFLNHWERNMPDIITGWNSEGFDIPTIINRIINIFGEDKVKLLSPWKMEPVVENHTMGGNTVYGIPGIIHYDYLKIFKKFALKYGNQESYKLDHIAYVVLGKKKLDYSEYDNLQHMYEEDHQKFIDYNIRDVDLVDRLEEQEGFIDVAFTIAYKANAPLHTVFGTVGVWDAFIYNYLQNKNIIIPPKEVRGGNGSFEGGYVKEVKVGMHEWIVSFDLNSLYPHLIMQFNMSPETLVDDIVPGVSVDNILDGQTYDIPEGHCMTAIGQLFRTDKQGFIPEIIDALYAERADTKQKMIKANAKLQKITDPVEKIKVGKEKAHYFNMQHAIKILMNSLYGAISNKYFRYFDIRIARSITLSGQLVNRWSDRTVNDLLNKTMGTKKDYIVAADTDSLYICLEDVVKKVTDSDDPQVICDLITKMSDKNIIPALNKAYDRLASLTQAYQQRMVMKQEVIANRAIWVAKKKYIANVLDDEGVRLAKPKIKVTGIESVRSSTPEVCRKLIEKSLELIINTDQSTVQEFISKAQKNFVRLRPEEVAFPRGITDIEKWQDSKTLYKKGTPIHVRASMLYNRQIADMDLSNKYDYIREGDKVKFLYLKMPNPLQENVFAFPAILPPEVNLEKYVDYDVQFEKTFLSPIVSILNAIGWNAEKKASLEDFF